MNSGLDWIGSVIWWIGLDWILKNGPTDISAIDRRRSTRVLSTRPTLLIAIEMLPFRCLSVCLSVTLVHCAQTAEDIDTISFAYDSPMSLPDCDKICRLNPSSPNFARNWSS